MALNFPINPDSDQIFTAGDNRWIYKNPPGAWSVLAPTATQTLIDIIASGLDSDVPENWTIWGDTLIQWGTVTSVTSGTGGISVVFDQPYQTDPKVILTTYNGAGYNAELIAPLSTAGFNGQVRRVSDGVVPTAAIIVHWIAMGEAPTALKQPKQINVIGVNANDYVPKTGGIYTGDLAIKNPIGSQLTIHKSDSNDYAQIVFYDKNNQYRANFVFDQLNRVVMSKWDSDGNYLGNIFLTDEDDLSVYFGGRIFCQAGFYADALSATENSHLYFRDNAQRNRGVIYWNYSDNSVRIQNYNTSGVVQQSFGIGMTYGSSTTTYSNVRFGSAQGYTCQAGAQGTVRSNNFNFDWTGSAFNAYVDAVNLGEIRNSQVSDMRVKEKLDGPRNENIIAQADKTSLEKIVAIDDPFWFKYRENGLYADDGKDRIGFSANQMREIIPEAVNGNPDDVDSDGNVVPMSIDVQPLVTHLLSAVKEQQKIIQTLTARIEVLENK